MPKRYRLSQFVIKIALTILATVSAQAVAGPQFESVTPELPNVATLVSVIVHNGFQLLALLGSAAFFMFMEHMTSRRRITSRERRLAMALALSVRSGQLEFVTAPRDPNAAFSIWNLPDDSDDEMDEPQRMPSRYALIAYHPAQIEAPVTCVTRMIGSDTTVIETELLKGVPRLLLKPEVEQEGPEVETETFPSYTWFNPEAQPDPELPVVQ